METTSAESSQGAGHLGALGRATVRLRWLIIGVWVIAVAASAPLAPRVPRVLSGGGFTSPDTESARAQALLSHQLDAGAATFLVFFSHPTLTVDDRQFADESGAALARLAGRPEVDRVLPYTLDPSQVSRDRHSAYAIVVLKSGGDVGSGLRASVGNWLGTPRDLHVLVGGGSVFYSDIQAVSEADLRRAELLAAPLAAIALLVVFRSVVAAAIPALVGGFSVVVSLALLYQYAVRAPTSVFALNITTLFGLGLGVDYSLFVVSRFREEIRRGLPSADAVAVTMSTAGRAVAFSGATVAVGLAGLFVIPTGMLRSVAVGGVLTVLLAVLAALTLLPAILGVLGRRIDALPIGRGLAGDSGAGPAGRRSGFWHRLASTVMARPLPIFAATLAVLVAFGAPFLQVRLGAPDASMLPPTAPSRAAYDLLTREFDAAETTPIVLAVRTDGSPLAPRSLDLLDEYVRTLRADPRVVRVESIVSLDPRLTQSQYRLLYRDPAAIPDPFVAAAVKSMAGADVTVVRVFGRQAMLDDESVSLVRSIRATPPPAGLTVLVSGGTAAIDDYVATLYGQFPRALGLVAAITFVVLALLLRSLVLPVKAILMNVLSILASYGALVFIFQEGHFASLLGFTPLGFVEASSPILMFCALFGLSMDYEVFLLSRVREAYVQGAGNAESVAIGLERSGRIITSAAAIVVLVSVAFASADLVVVKALGVGMALAVLLDATLVRGLLVPATMRLLGDLNWWWPAPLERWLPAGIGARSERTSGEPTSPRGAGSR